MTWSVRDRGIVITGANSGIGEAAAGELAKRGARVVLAVRDPVKGRATAERMAGDVSVAELDLGSMESIRRFAETFVAEHDDLAVLVNNAGVFLGRRRFTNDGFEMTMGVNHLGHFLLTNLLLARLRGSAPSRVITVSSGGHHFAKRGIDLDHLADGARRYRMAEAYGRSKLANILFSRELARREGASGITAYSLHPGEVATRIGRDGDSWLAAAAWWIRRRSLLSPEEGARTIVWLATEPGIEKETGGYFYDCRPSKPSAHGRDDELARRLWDRSADLVASALP